MRSLLDRASDVALDLLFPPHCALCRRGGSMLCAACASDLPEAAGLRCERCWMPISRERTCRHCDERPPAFETIRAAFTMDGDARRLAHLLKYGEMHALARPMAGLMAARLPLPSVDLVTAVPLHAGRMRSRGYNQSAYLARHLAELAGLQFDERAAKRVRRTAPLAKTMRREERRAIVEGAFAASPKHVRGQTVLLVDDVVTTGATLDACASALRDAGAKSVRCVTWARAD